MKFGRLRHQGRSCAAVLHGAELHLLDRDVSSNDLASVADLASASRSVIVPEADADYLVPVMRPSKIVAVGLNYPTHTDESGMDDPAAPLLFAKMPSSLVAHNGVIQWDSALTQQVDFEGELAVVIGRRTAHVMPEAALDHVFGYTVANDVSARDVQFGDGQWMRGKSFDTFCPLGPYIVTADEIPDPQNLRIVTRVNDAVMQDESTSEMLFSVADIISYVSGSMTLEPGDVILTGTPSGVGFARNPPRFLQPGDAVSIVIEGIGELRNEVKAL